MAEPRKHGTPEQTHHYQKIKMVIKSLPQNISSDPHDFTSEFFQTFTENLLPILCILFKEIEETETLLNCVYEVNITLIPKETEMSKKELKVDTLLNTDANILNKNPSKSNPTIHPLKRP